MEQMNAYKIIQLMRTIKLEELFYIYLWEPSDILRVQSHGTWFVKTADSPANWRRMSGHLETLQSLREEEEENNIVCFYFLSIATHLFVKLINGQEWSVHIIS